MNNCEKYRGMISLMLDGELAEPQKTELEAHLAVCGECARLYAAFAFISSSIDEGLSDPPESLRADVMNRIRAQGARQPAAIRRPRVWGRLAALAACLAVVIFAAAKSGVFFSAGTSSSAADEQTVEYATAAAPASAYGGAAENAGVSAEEPPQDTLGASEATPGTDATATPFATGENRAIIAQEDSRDGEALMQTAGDANLATEKSVSLMEVSSISVFSGDSEVPDPEPITTVTDEKSIVAVMDLLAFSEAGEEVQVSGAPVFIFKVIKEDGSSYNLSVWIVDGRICCVSDVDGVLYIAAGDAGDLFAFIAAA